MSNNNKLMALICQTNKKMEAQQEIVCDAQRKLTCPICGADCRHLMNGVATMKCGMIYDFKVRMGCCQTRGQCEEATGIALRNIKWESPSETELKEMEGK